MNKKQLRRYIRTCRQQLSPQQQNTAAEQLAERLMTLVKQNNAQRVALFLSMDGEIHTDLAIKELWQAKVEVYLPVIHPFNDKTLLFIRYQADTPLIRADLGMLEPQLNCQHVCPLNQLDILFTPLVAFDAEGNRLGMGGGFYDRTLAVHYRQKRSQPQTIGLAHDCQQVDKVPVEPWDLPLAQIITPSQHFQF
ncbi:MAG: 5-formyltetrahydrofolate cyclo-ligase [Phenylobacterium sp.]|jgi:5-formyltetrahydrofolate cyclo-ligase